MQYEVMRRVRLPLIILVTYAHSYGAIRGGYSLLGSGWDAYEVLKLMISQTLVKVAVPAFFVMSGYLFFANVEKLTKEVYDGHREEAYQSEDAPCHPLVWEGVKHSHTKEDKQVADSGG